MRKFPCFCSILLFLLTAVQARNIIQMPIKPANPKAGRVLKLEKVMRITDEGGGFFIQYPRFLKVAPDDSIYFCDRDQLIHLDRDGHFLKNLFKKGQGPGELNYLSNYVITDSQVIVHGSDPSKLLTFGFDGRLQDEISLQGLNSRLRFNCIRKGILYFINAAFPHTEKASAVIDWDHMLVMLSEHKDKLEELVNFPIETLVMGGGAVSNLSLLTALVQDRYLCAVHTAEYKIRIFDLESNEIVREITRKYKRNKRPEGQGASAIIKMNGKIYTAPGSDYLNDISALYAFQDRLWVLTSTKDEKKGQLIDVYSIDGDYLDSFYLNVKGSLFSTYKDCIFVRETNEDELVSIVKYRVKG